MVLYINSKVNSVTGIAPYVLVFGRQPNDLKKEAENLTDSENAELIQRNFQLENVVEALRPSAVQNIENNHKVQTKTQDKRNNIEETPLTEGKIVLRKMREFIPS